MIKTHANSRSPGRPRHPVLDEVYADLKKDILADQSESEVLLPSHQQLTFRYGISQMSLSKLMKRCASEGLISCRPGNGTYILPKRGIVAHKPTSQEPELCHLSIGNNEFPPHHKEVWEEVYQNFEKQNPLLRLHSMRYSGHAQLDEKHEGELPDVFQVYASSVPFLAAEGKIANLDDHINVYGLDDLHGMDACRYQGHTYAIPQEVISQVLYTNMDLLAKLGISDHDFAPDAEELLELAEKLANTKNFHGNCICFPSYTSLLSAMGLLSDQLLPDDSFFENPKVIHALEWIEKMSRIPGALSFTSHEKATGFQRFESRKSLFFCSGTYYADHIANTNINSRALSLDRLGKNTRPDLIAWVIKADADNPIQAWNWIRHLISTPNQTRLTRKRGNFPALKNREVEQAYAEVCTPGLSDRMQELPETFLPSLAHDAANLFSSHVWSNSVSRLYKGIIDSAQTLQEMKLAHRILAKSEKHRHIERALQPLL